MPGIPKPATYLAEIDQLPPWKCWLLARRGRGLSISQAEITKATGWSPKKVETICGLKTWRGIPIDQADAFRAACGITRANERRHKFYLKRTLDLGKTVSGLLHVRKRPGIAQRRLRRIAKELTSPSLPAAA